MLFYFYFEYNLKLVIYVINICGILFRKCEYNIDGILILIVFVLVFFRFNLIGIKL